MGESTQYPVLGIVALVAIVAIFAMMNATTSDSVTSSSQETIAGAATSYSLPPYSQLDYDSDGRVSADDRSILADAIALDACPDGYTCDLDRNRVLDERDLALFNSLLSEPREEPVQQTVMTGNVVREPLRTGVVVGYSSVTTTLA